MCFNSAKSAKSSKTAKLLTRKSVNSVVQLLNDKIKSVDISLHLTDTQPMA